MSGKKYILLTLCLLTGLMAYGQTAGKAPLSVSGEGDSLVRVHFSWPGGPGLMMVGWGHTVLLVDGLHFNTGQVGAPDLPTASTLVRLPAGSTLETSSFKADEMLLKGFVFPEEPLAPVTKAWAKDQGWPGYEPDEKIYSSDAFYRGGDQIDIEDLGVMGGEQLFRITLRPVAYNPVSGDLRVDTLLAATLSVGLPSPHTSISTPRYLIVSRPEFREGLQPFVHWKRQEGFDVVELYSNTSLKDSVKALIDPFFDLASPLTPAPTHMLIVGDADQIEPFRGSATLNGTGHLTDLPFAEHTGDYLPEALLGRWPVNDTSELGIVVRKTLAYEQFRDIDTLQLKRLLVVAGSEESGVAPTTTNGQVNYVSREAKAAHPSLDTLCYHNPQSALLRDSIVSNIGRGASLLNYTAHCGTQGWTSPALTADIIATAEATQPMVYVNNCCKSNSFGGDCFGEELLRMPQGGAVGVIGATNSTLWNEDYYWAVGPKEPIVLAPLYDSTALGAFDRLLGRVSDISTLGELLAAGNLAVTAFSTGYARFYWEAYCLLGDPALQPWIGVPQPIALQITDSLHNGENLVQVSGTPGARVSALQGDELLGVDTLDSSGHALIELRQPLDTLPLVVTATGVGLRPRIDTFAVDTVERGVTLRHVTVNDSTVLCTVENIGNTRFDSLRVELSQARGQQSGNGAVIEFQIVVIDSLPPHSRTEVALPVNIVELGQQPLWNALLYLWDSDNGVMCWQALSNSLSVTYPTLRVRLLDNNGREARRVLPGHDYTLEADIENDFDSLTLSLGANGHLFLPDTTLHSPLSTLHFPFSTPDSLCTLHATATLYLGGWRHRSAIVFEPGERTEGFEAGFDGHPWHNTSRRPWVIDSAVSHSGGFSARSGTIGHSQVTDLSLTVNLTHSDTVSFWVKTSSETSYDKLTFLVDGYRRSPEAWGETDWLHRTYVVDSGRHTLTWRYAKDHERSVGEDCAWIDDIRLPLSLWDTTYGWPCATPAVGIDDTPTLASEHHLTLYPNPAGDKIWLLADMPMRITVTDLMGRRVDEFAISADAAIPHEVAALPAGAYFITGTGGTHTASLKLIIRKD